jgi:hypothetical protein
LTTSESRILGVDDTITLKLDAMNMLLDNNTAIFTIGDADIWPKPISEDYLSTIRGKD